MIKKVLSRAVIVSAVLLSFNSFSSVEAQANAMDLCIAAADTAEIFETRIVELCKNANSDTASCIAAADTAEIFETRIVELCRNVNSDTASCIAAADAAEIFETRIVELCSAPQQEPQQEISEREQFALCVLDYTARGMSEPTAVAVCEIDFDVSLRTTPSAPALVDRYASIAYSPTEGYYGMSWNYFSPVRAEREALAECNLSDCKTVMVISSGYAALAVADDQSWGAGQSNVRQEALEQAIASCRNYSRVPDTCEILTTVRTDASE